MKTKHAFIIFSIGYLLTYLGALLKILHWPGANAILVFATLLEIGGGLLLVSKLVSHPKLREFFNW
jgi:hypothetical protein